MHRVVLLCLGVAVLLAGCLASQTYSVSMEQASPRSNISVVDARPDEEKSYKSRSGMTFSCEYGIHDLGDSNTLPPPMAVLRAAIDKRVDTPTPLAITIQHLRLINNLQIPLRRTAFRDPLRTGPCIAGIDIAGGVDPRQNPDYLPQMTVLISGLANGIPVSSEVTIPYAVGTSLPYQDKDATTQAISKALSEATLKFANEIVGILKP
jgi:hypothetical protein